MNMWVKSESLAPPAFLNSRETREPRPLASKSVRKRRAIIDYPSTALTRSCLLHGLEFSDSFGVFLTRRRHFGFLVLPFFHLFSVNLIQWKTQSWTIPFIRIIKQCGSPQRSASSFPIESQTHTLFFSPGIRWRIRMQSSSVLSWLHPDLAPWQEPISRLDCIHLGTMSWALRDKTMPCCLTGLCLS